MNITATRKNNTNDFRINLAMYSFTQNDSVNVLPENVASRRILTKMKGSVFHRI